MIIWYLPIIWFVTYLVPITYLIGNPRYEYHYLLPNIKWYLNT